MACLSVSFEEILGGAAGQVEAEAAAKWLSKPSLYELPGDLVGTESGLDMRVVDADFHKRRRRTSGAHLLPALQPQARNPTGKAPGSKRPAASVLQQQPPPPQRKPATGAAPAAPAAKPPAAENLYSRAAYLSHSDAIGLAARRKARPSTEFQLPLGWQPYGPPAGKARGGKAQQQKPEAAPGKQQSQRGGDEQQQTEVQQYMSPEGLVLPSLQRVQAVLQGPALVPLKLVKWLKSAAADPAEAQKAGVTAVGQAHLLGLLRMRVLLVEADRQRMRRRLKTAAAPGGGAQGALVPPTQQQQQQQQRRRSQRVQPA